MGKQRTITPTTSLRRPGRNTLVVALLSAVLSIVVIAGCGSDSETDTANEATPTTATDNDNDGDGDGDRDAAATTTSTASADEVVTGDGGSEVGAVRFELEGQLPLEETEVNEMLDFVEERTGRRFLHPPTIVAQDDETFEAGLAEMFGDELAQLDEDAELAARSYQALGLSEQTPSELVTNIEALMTSTQGIGGYYDPEDDALYVPVTDEATDEFRSVLVHELTHALDGQHVDLAAIIDHIEANEDETETNFGLQALVEGRATLVQGEWMMANGITPTATELTELIEAVPPAFVNQISMPYVFGSSYVGANGGAATTWELYESGPTSSEQVLFPDTDPTEEIVELAQPEADGDVLLSGTFGAADIVLWLLSDSFNPSPAVATAAMEAADGWAGGQTVLWGDEEESCVRIVVAADTEDDLTELEAAFQQWADDGDGRTVEATADLVTATGCAPFRS